MTVKSLGPQSLFSAAGLRLARQRLPVVLETAIDFLRLDVARTLGAISAIGAGVAVIVSLVSIAAGGRKEIMRSVEAAGPSNVFVRVRASGNLASSSLSTADLDRLRTWIPGLVTGGNLRISIQEVSFGAASEKVPVYAIDAGISDVFPLKAAQGRLIAPLDVAGRAKRIVIGSHLAKRFGPGSRILGKRMEMGPETFEVVGVLRPISTDFGSSAVDFVPDWNRGILLPLGAEPGAAVAPDRDYPIDLGVLRFSTPAAASRGAWLLDGLQKKVARGPALSISTPLQALAQYRAARRSFDRVVLLVALLTTFTAGFGIHTLLWSAVRARGSEIGIRRAVGASSFDIRLQFLAESFLLGTAGGLVGVATGVSLSLLLLTGAGWRPEFELFSLTLMAAGASVCGIASGIRPAAAAAHLDPAAALRIE
jgi:ABC-type antimicrobial peptide transport system permease subunit